jgi:hypothetical protein
LELINYMFGRKWRIMDANAEVYWVYWQTWHRWPGKGQELPVKLSKSRKFRQVVDLIFQTSVDRPRNAETDEIS